MGKVQRGSQRASRSSNNSSSSPGNPRKRIKRCCRNFVTFMCTQVGVGALIVFYAICGAISFMHIEREYIDDTPAQVLALRHNCTQELWYITEELNIFDRHQWQSEADEVLQRYQIKIAAILKNGYDGRTPEQMWSFPAALMFCLSVITMIGYGNMVPRTPWGKGFTVIYATFGIPLYILYFLNMGRVLARSFKFLYRSMHDCTRDRDSIDAQLDALESASMAALQRKKVIVPSTACLWVIIFYIFTGTIMFANWEKWSLLNSFYFCMTSLCKIGFGDFVPGASLVTAADVTAASEKVKEDASADPDVVTNLQLITDRHSKLAINFLYMLIGMGLVAMCYNLMREEEAIIDNFLKLQKRVTNSEVMLGGSADRLCTPSTSAGPFRIFDVAGFQNRANDIVYCPPVIRQPSTQNVEDSTAIVYFGGDVQDFPESMETNRDSRGYMKYNLENSAILLREAFPRSHIIVIRPVRMEFKTFSCFDNFVRGNNAGVPDHTPMNHALQHLEKLLQNLSQRLISIPENEIMDQAAQAAAVAAAVSAAAAAGHPDVVVAAHNAVAATAAALVSSTLSTASSDSSSSSSTASDSSQEMDIDILQVQENVTVDSDGAVIFPNAITNTNTVVNNSATAATTGNESTNAVAIIANPQQVNNAATTVNTTNANAETCVHACQTLNDGGVGLQHFNNVNNCHNCPQQHQQQQQQQQDQQPHNNNPLWWRENLNLDKSKLILIGFSKGCVVLNQFIYEFHYLKTLTPDDSTMIRLLSRIKDMYWLDGGHGGQKNTWITSRSLLETLTRMGMSIHVHLTPYQVQDDRRPWIRKEEKIFTDLLRRLGAPITRHLHYDSQTANLMTHFEVLQAFCQHIQALNQQQQEQQQRSHSDQHSSDTQLSAPTLVDAELQGQANQLTGQTQQQSSNIQQQCNEQQQHQKQQSSAQQLQQANNSNRVVAEVNENADGAEK